MVVLDELGLHGAEGTDAHMQGHETVRHLCENLRREVQTGGGRGDGALVLGIDGPGESQALFEQPLSTAASMGFATSKALCAGYAKAFSKVDHYNVIGIGSDSVQFNFSGSNYEKVLVDGDGTVTKNSACAGNLFTSNLIELRLTHVELVTDSGSINTIIDLMY